MLEYTVESELAANGFGAVCGIDEAGRGPLCGPVVAAACILPCGLELAGLNDSKKLSAKNREALYDEITKKAVAFGIGTADVREIDELNILEATLAAMHRAVAALPVRADYLLVDGNVFRDFEIDGRCVIGGDAKVPSIAAASVLAKVTRDRICLELDREYPEYMIAKNKGYGTAEHMAALRRFGPSPCHRKKFIRFLNDDGAR